MKILVTNDDGVNSVLYPPLVEVADSIGESFLCVPASEQSWRGKSMTRLAPFEISKGRTCTGREAITPNGTPADCVRYALEVLIPSSPPNLIFSGINYGLNSGIGYLSSSGTAGACFEGNLYGLPGICVSQELSVENWKYLHSHGTLPHEVINQLVPQAIRILTPAIKKILGTKEMLSRPLTWSINIPQKPITDELTLAPVSSARYKITYQEKDQDCYTKMVGVTTISPPSDKPSDTNLVKAGYPTLTIIDLFSLGQMTEDYARETIRDWNNINNYK